MQACSITCKDGSADQDTTTTHPPNLPTLHKFYQNDAVVHLQL